MIDLTEGGLHARKALSTAFKHQNGLAMTVVPRYSARKGFGGCTINLKIGVERSSPCIAVHYAFLDHELRLIRSFDPLKQLLMLQHVASESQMRYGVTLQKHKSGADRMVEARRLAITVVSDISRESSVSHKMFVS
jgi:hypothetical protein